MEGEDGNGGVEDGVAGAVLLVHVNAHVGGHAKLGESSLGVHHGARREAHAPAVGQFAGEGQSAAAARGVAHDGDVAQRLHDRDEVVSRAEGGAVGEHDDGLEVVDVVFGGLEVVGVGLTQVVMTLAGLVADVAGEGLAADETRDEFLDVGEQAAAVVARRRCRARR